jgi:biuret amidohydrolase
LSSHPVDTFGGGEGKALAVIDMTYSAAHVDYGWIRYHRARGETAMCDYYASRLESLTIPNIRRAIDKFRELSLPIYYTSCVARSSDFSDLNVHAHRIIEQCRLTEIPVPYCTADERAAQVLDDLRPLSNEPIVYKPDYSAFNRTSFAADLRRDGVQTLYFVGVGTNYCVAFSVFDAYDAGFDCVLIEDATATLSSQEQIDGVASVRAHAQVMLTASALAFVQQASDARRATAADPLQVS